MKMFNIQLDLICKELVLAQWFLFSLTINLKEYYANICKYSWSRKLLYTGQLLLALQKEFSKLLHNYFVSHFFVKMLSIA